MSKKTKIKFGKFGNIDFWWFAQDNLNSKRKGRGYWQIMAHFFPKHWFFETVIISGRYCGRVIAGDWLYLEWWRGKRKCFSPFLTWFVRYYRRTKE